MIEFRAYIFVRFLFVFGPPSRARVAYYLEAGGCVSTRCGWRKLLKGRNY